MGLSTAFLALWLLVGFGQWGVPVEDPREGGGRGQDIYAPGSFFATGLAASLEPGATGPVMQPLPLSRLGLWVSVPFSHTCEESFI